jgi:adenosylcobinamide kinase/adenosylcobinamide-phosphate guanylyltransferase
MRTLITGGIKSGKSRQALLLASEFETPRYFLATAEAFDAEMKERIRRHRADRAEAFITIEEPLAIEDCLHENMVLDCVTVWMNNMLYYGKENSIPSALNTLMERLPRAIVIVTNEVGSGIIPADPLSRTFADLLGKANARLASVCDSVILMVSGIPVIIKQP